MYVHISIKTPSADMHDYIDLSGGNISEFVPYISLYRFAL